jgi:hypothetical protein
MQFMKYFYAAVCLMLSYSLQAQSNQVAIVNDNNGIKLVVDNQDFMINGMNWDYLPIGTNYNYSLWNQSDNFIKSALDVEMSLLSNMGVNAIRVYTGIPARWITYIYNNHGIYTMLNHSFGRYGLNVEGAWIATTDYANPSTQALLVKEVTEMAEQYKNTPGLLLFLLGNENNYGLFWDGAETENIPIEERKSTERAQSLYEMFNQGALAIKGIDTNHPVALCNGDLLFLDIIAEKCPDVDIFGTNMYRGVSFGDAFERVKNEYGKPLLFTEFGADAFNAQSNSEDQGAQAYYMSGNWKEIYANAAGMGKTGNSLGGFTFQFSDGWWKFGQTKNLSVHDNNASWSNGGYLMDFVEGENNMNEEWFGICAKGQTEVNGMYELYPRAAYYALKNAHGFNPYEAGNDLGKLEQYFNDKVRLSDAVLTARGDKAALQTEKLKYIQLSRFSAEFTTFNTGGNLITTPKNADPNVRQYPDQLGFDHMQSFFVGIEANPAPNLRASVEFNMVGNVAQNPINEIFYENRARPVTVNTTNGNVRFNDVNRFQVYNASLNWNHKWFNLDAFYRTGHFHWQYEGDFFGLYQEANYGPNIDIYNGEAPVGFEIELKKQLRGLKLAFGPELWWGANPALLVKYHREFKNYEIAGVFHEDIAQRGTTESSFAIPQPKTRRATLYAHADYGKFGIGLGGIWGGNPLNGRAYQVTRGDNGNPEVLETTIKPQDNWGGKMKTTYTGGKFNWYAQGAAMGLVANGGADATITYTGWKLKDSGSGNQYNFLTGLTYNIGNFQIAPNFLWQRPVEGPMLADVQAPGRLRNILDDPFVVRGNREQIAGEILFSFDPTPATYMYEWDNDFAEDAKFAASAGFIFRRLPTSQDAAIGILPNGRTTFAFPGAAPAQDLWEAHARIVSKINPDFGIIGNFYGGKAQANGDSERSINRVGGDVRVIYKQLKLTTAVKLNDWGPYDYHRDFNLTYPVQLILDISTVLGKPSWKFIPQTKIGVMGTWRALNQYSDRYCPGTTIDVNGDEVCVTDLSGYENGNEWEIRAYIHLNVGANR